MTGLSRCGKQYPESGGEWVESDGCKVEVAMPERPPRKTLWVTRKAHESVSSMQKILADRYGYPVTQSETVMKGMQALTEKMEAGK